MSEPLPVSVYLVDDHNVVREGLRAIIEREPDLSIVGESGSAEEALMDLPDLAPDVVVVDQRLPGLAGVELCREIAERRLRSQVVILSGFVEDRTVEAAFRAGAKGYVMKDVESKELLRAIRASARGVATIDPKVGGRFQRWVETDEPDPSAAISPRYTAILSQLVEGLQIADIADRLGLTEQTLKSYMRELYHRLGVRTRSQAVAVAIRKRLV